MTSSIHHRTPSVKAHDPRRLPVRHVDYLRKVAGGAVETLITRQQHDGAGRLVAKWDPRLFGIASEPNLATVYTLAGEPLKIDSVDAGWRVSLAGLAGEALQRWDQRGHHWRTTHDPQLRVIAVEENAQPNVETFTYAAASADAGHNLRGQMIALNDPSGTVTFHSFGLLGQTLSQTRTFDDARPHFSRQTYGPLNQTLTQTDAGGHFQDLRYDVTGQLKQVFLLRSDASQPQAVLQDAHYNAAGQIIEWHAGNNVVTRWRYDAADGRLTAVQAAVPGQEQLQDLEYVFDLVGNMLRINDHTFNSVYFANQSIDGHREFTYDSLYRLNSASGHDVTPASDVPGRPQPSDPNDLRNYTQHYEYGLGGNLIKLVHSRETGGYTRQMRVDPSNNRALRWKTGDPPPDFAAFFDRHGNQVKLQHGPDLIWNALDHLSQVTLLKHSNDLPDDREVYRYSQGERVSKRHETHTASATHFHQVRYLPGLEIRTRDNGEELHVITLPGNVRCLHWRHAPPGDIENNQLRYSLNDHLGSSLTELDQRARVISQETYYPFGGSALWLPASSTVVDYKTLRYSGKEMDVSGLYYYGVRYYAPWLQRWVSADPAGDVDGLNLYGFVGNNPLRYIDESGFVKTESQRREELRAFASNISSANKIVDRYDSLLGRLFESSEKNKMIGKNVAITLISGFLTTGAGIAGGVLGGLAGSAILPGPGTGAGAALGALATKEAVSYGIKELGKKINMEPGLVPKAKEITWQKAEQKNLPIFSLAYAEMTYNDYQLGTEQGQKNAFKWLVEKNLKNSLRMVQVL
ncbi:RHS repeat-associated core domain-containing protein [Pseudomonas lini]